MEKLAQLQYNFPVILLSALFCLFAMSNAESANGAGMILLAVLSIPLIVAAITVGAHLLLKKFVPALAWLPTLIGAGFLVLLGVRTIAG